MHSYQEAVTDITLARNGGLILAGRNLEKVIDSYSVIVGIIRLAGLKHDLEFVKDEQTLAESLYIYLYDADTCSQIRFVGYPSITISSTGNIKLRAEQRYDVLNSMLNNYESAQKWKEETHCSAFYGDSDNIIFGLSALLLSNKFYQN